MDIKQKFKTLRRTRVSRLCTRLGRRFDGTPVADTRDFLMATLVAAMNAVRSLAKP